MPSAASSPAEEAAEAVRARMYECIDSRKSFRLEAGAGAGKTHSLVQALKYLIGRDGTELQRKHQQIACITFTNVATQEIESRTDRHPAIRSSTIHAFCWRLIKDFQPSLRAHLPKIDRWSEILQEVGGAGSRRVGYDEFGHRRVDETSIALHHDDVLTLTIELMKDAKFRTLLTHRFPILLIDEYQDTNKDFVEALKNHFLATGEGPLIGFFGDHWQKIYGYGCGKIEHPNLKVLGKEANFRSVPLIVECLNRMRPELPQKVKDPNAKGFVGIYQTNGWSGLRRTGQHWGGDLPAEKAHVYLNLLKKQLETEGWDLSAEKTKILMLTHKVLAAEQGYGNIESIFEYNDAFVKKEDAHIAFFCDILEPVCAAYERRHFGEMFAILGGGTPGVGLGSDKTTWARDMDELLKLRESGTIGAVLDHLKKTNRPKLPDAVDRKERELANKAEAATADEASSIGRLRKLRDISYKEIIALDRFIDEKTPFSTKHGVKGAEFENVIVVFGRGWNQYDFNQFLEWAGTPNRIPQKKQDAYERNRNLFYVVCSRPKTRLAALFTQELTNSALKTLSDWFGSASIHSLI
jgi:ATP-dependent DNA helicase UvrD/PcrA